MTESGGFTRDFEIELVAKTLKLSQKFEGDVGCVVWDAAIVLAKYLEELCKEKRDFLENINVLELGAGVGCVGLAAACLGAENVLLTDLTENVALLNINIQLNRHSIGEKVKSKELSWGCKNIINNNELKPDLIVLADCIYYKESIDALIQTLRDLSNENTKILLSQELRDSEKQKECWKYFMSNVSKYFSTNFIPLKEHNPDFRSPDILILSLKKIKSPANGYNK